MTSIYYIERQCPLCDSSFKDIDILSTNSVHDYHYTDGTYVREIDSQHTEIKRCSICGDIYWENDAITCESDNPFNRIEQNKINELKFNERPSCAACESFIKTLGDLNEVMNIRLQIWRTLNWRALRLNTSNVSKFQSKNMNKILTLIDDSNESEILIRAEINRNLGHFNIVSSLLNKTFSKNNQLVADTILQLTDMKIQKRWNLKKAISKHSIG